MAHSNETIQNLIQDTYKEDECADWLQGWLDGLGDINMLYEWEQYLTGEMTFDEWTNVCIETHKQITLVSGPPYPEHAAFLYNHAM